MPRRKDRTARAVRKIKKRLPSGIVKVVFERRKAKPNGKCAICKSPLRGLGEGAKTEKRPERKFGGHLCHKCSEKVIKFATRIKEKELTIEDVPLLYRDYVEVLLK